MRVCVCVCLRVCVCVCVYVLYNIHLASVGFEHSVCRGSLMTMSHHHLKV